MTLNMVYLWFNIRILNISFKSVEGLLYMEISILNPEYEGQEFNRNFWALGQELQLI
jgi:hypothetical protein